MSIIKYNIEYIFKFKDIILNEDNKKKLDELKKLMNYDNKVCKVKISKNVVLNNSKWCRKLFLTNNEKKFKKINSYFNMCSKVNYEKIAIDIFKIRIESSDQLDYLIDLLIQKYRFDYTNDIWNVLIKNIIFVNVYKWKFDDKYPIERLLDKVNNLLNEIINSEYQQNLEKYFDENIELFYKIKKINNGLMKLITYLFSFELLSKKIITEILKDLTLDVKQYYKLELGVVLIKYLFEYINENEKKKFLEYFEIFLKDDKLNKKVKFMILDFFDEQNNNTLDDSNINNEDYEFIIKNNINETINENDISIMTDLIRNIESKCNLNVLTYYITLFIIENKDKYDSTLKIFLNLFNTNKIKVNCVKYGLINFIKDYDEYKYDNLNINESLNKYFNDLIKSNVMTKNNIEFILSKTEDSVRKSINFK